MIIKSPGVPYKKIELYVSGKNIITTESEIFFDNCKGKIIGITGTKGKSTTSALIYENLKKEEKNVFLMGNIGIPVLKFLSKNVTNPIFVYELSSHQLYNLKRSPKVAVFLNVYPEHLDYYKDFQDYFLAKANICLHQKKSDFLVYNAKDKIVANIASKSKAKKIDFNSVKIDEVINRKDISLKGDFYLQNIKSAIAVARIFKVRDESIEKAIKKFKPLPHRLEFIGKFKEIDFYNDSLATIPQATESAIEALGENLETIILGGFDRGADFSSLAKRIVDCKIKNLIIFPMSGLRILEEVKKECKTRGKIVPSHFFVGNMKEAVELCYKNTSKGKICLLSPASPSFGKFKDYQERGDLFIKFVKEQV